MANVAVIGAQWGDEGKGKIVDWLSERADVVVRFQGGHNAGHTLVIGGKTFKLSLLPSGVVRPGKLSILGNGVVVDPWALLAEIEKIRAMGVDVSPANLRVADNAALILPLHGELDRLREEASGAAKIGTTGRGIGPAYEDKIGRRAIRVCDLFDAKALDDKITRLLAHHNALRRGLGAPEIDRNALFASLVEVGQKLLPYAEQVSSRLYELRRAGIRILFEGAQGTMLDVDHGTYPYVTSSNTVAGGAAIGAGLGPRAIGYVLGITKAYTTRVGNGPFPTEQNNAIGERLGTRGHEFGTVTGRKRRCGWFDAVMVRQAVRTGGSGDVSASHGIWRMNKGSNVSSPIYFEGHLYWTRDGNIACCQNPATGEMVYEERLEPGSGTIWSSPVLADGKLYYVSQRKGTFVIAAQPKFELLAHNVFEDDDSRTNASPAVSNGQLFLRTDRYLYCIGAK